MKILFILLLSPILLLAQNDSGYYNDQHFRYDNHIYKKNIRTPLLHPKSFQLSFPIIALNSGEQFLLSFDDLSPNINNYTYTLIHCTYDWQPTTNLFTSDYIKGYSEENISTYEYSFNTFQKYIHYSVAFPHENMQITKSGNYLLKVYQDYNPDNVVLTMRLMVVDEQFEIQPSLRASSVPGDQSFKHELDFNLLTSGKDITDPFSEIKIVMLQNYNWSQQVSGLKPRFISGESLNYNYDGENNFDAGNEWRYFDIRSLRFQSERILAYEQGSDNICHTLLKPDDKRTFKQFRVYGDINGERSIEVQEGNRDEIEADYSYVHFKLNAPQPVTDGTVYVFGQLTNWEFLPEAKMKYNEETKAYESNLLLKQGYYNYKYVVLRDKQSKPDEGYFEGNFYQTENVYQVLVYFKSVVGDYYQLLGTSLVKSALR
ncbi:MAG: DUF5103 domain-containing protein [Flavobacteriales bacterium]